MAEAPQHDSRPTGRGVWRFAWRALGIVSGVYLITLLLLYFFQSRLIYFPTRGIEVTPQTLGLAYEDVAFRAADGVELCGWYVPARRRRGVVLFFHGNGGNISHRLETLSLLNGLGLSTLIIDYRGYGRSQGAPSEAGTYLDAQAAWDYLLNVRGAAPESVILFGRSLGGVFAARLAGEHTPAAAIVESAFTSIPDRGAELFPFLPIRRLSRFRYATIEYIAAVRCPVLVVHSRDDRTIPFHHGQKLFEAAPEPKRFLEIAGSHNDGFLLSAGKYIGGLDAFLTEHLGR